MSELSVWRLDDGGELHWVVASTDDEARALLVEDMRKCGLDDYTVASIEKCERLPDDHVLNCSDEGHRQLSKSCREWVSDSGRGYLGGTCW